MRLTRTFKTMAIMLLIAFTIVTSSVFATDVHQSQTANYNTSNSESSGVKFAVETRTIVTANNEDIGYRITAYPLQNEHGNANPITSYRTSKRIVTEYGGTKYNAERSIFTPRPKRAPTN